jgi:3-dehydroquinate dehydratase/shikimate dehydrogenase
MTKIACPIFITADLDLEETFAAANDAGADWIELRCDQSSEKQMLEAIDESPRPVIVTVRPTWEGGKYNGPENKRIGLLESAIEAGADFIDIELVALERDKKILPRLQDAAEKSGTRIIISHHDFAGRPKDVNDCMRRLSAFKNPGGIRKLVWQAQSILCAIDALSMCNKDQLVIAMGEEGVISRILAKVANAPFTFGTIETGKESAPGQITIEKLRNLYRWEKQNPKSPVCGVVGWPVGHSVSPHIHNAGFDSINSDAVYVPLAIREDYNSFAAAIDALRKIVALKGLSVTIPHKENALRYANENAATIDPIAAKLGVSNTLVFDGKKIHATNTDYHGALDALLAAMNADRTALAGIEVAILGAGGAARAIVSALADAGAKVTIYNRTFERAQELAKTFSVNAEPWENLPAATPRIIINCTPLGMYPKINANPIDFDPGEKWNENTIVFDTVYNPLRTQLLKLAEKKGAKIATGLEMLIRQAAVQFKLFTGKEAPINLFREVAKKPLTTK